MHNASTSKRLIRLSLIFNLILMVVVGAVSFTPTSHAAAQGDAAQLVGRALLPANEQTDGPPAGKFLSSGGALINGIRVPFDGQPVGTISSVLPGEYPGTLLALISGQFSSSDKSADFLLRFYVLSLDLRKVGSGQGEAAPIDYRSLADPDRHIAETIVNNDTPTRYLTGRDFAPRAFQRGGDGAYWVAEDRTPSLLRFDSVGKLLEPPVRIEGGALQGMSITPDRGKLIVALRNGQSVAFRAYDLTTRTFSDLSNGYRLDRNGNTVGGIAMINTDQALVIEHDDQQNSRAGFKQVFLYNVTAGGDKTPLANLLNIADPNTISTDSVFRPPASAFGLGATFKFPFRAISAIYPQDEQTILVVNNNRLPDGLGRSSKQADATEFITLRVTTFPVDPAFLRGVR